MLTRWFCQQEIIQAIDSHTQIQLLLETETRFNAFDEVAWKQRLWRRNMDLIACGRLEDAPEAKARAPVAALPSPVLFCDVAEGRDEKAPVGSSMLNRAEVAAAVSVVQRLRSELPAASLCVLAPYRGQVGAVRRALARAGVGGIEVATVDGFQGREQEVVVFSCVRANDEGRLGFLADPRRLNVALTRARRGLVVLGHRATLRHDPAWASWLGFVDEHDLEGAVLAVGGHNCQRVVDG